MDALDRIAIGHRVATLRHSRQLSVETAAHLAGGSRRWLYDVEAGHAALPIEAINGLAAAFGVSPAVIECIDPIPEVKAAMADGALGLVHEDDVADITRRTLLSGIANAAAIPIAARIASLAATSDRTSVADKHIIEELEFVTAQYGSWCWRLSAPLFLRRVGAHQVHLAELLGTARGTAARRLKVLLAQTAVFGSLAAYRQHHFRAARDQARLAEDLANEADDPTTVAMVLGIRRPLLRSIGSGERERARDALDLMDTAIETVGRGGPPLLLTWLYCCRSEDAAAMGMEEDALRSVDLADRYVAAAGPPSTGFFDHWDAPRVNGWRASAFLYLKQGAPAAEILETVVASTPESLPGPRAATVADLGTAYALAGHPDHAADLLRSALTIAQARGLESTVTRVRRARLQHLRGRGDIPAVRRLDEALSV